MKFLHISDLHLGKRFSEFSLIEDQQYILYKIINCIDEQKPDALVIAGDVYDKNIPSVEAIKLFDEFLCKLAERKIQVYIISGNHDSAERMTCGASLMEASGIHFAKAYEGTVSCYTLQDKDGPVNFYLLPFIKPAVVKSVFPEEADKINSYTDAVRLAVQKAAPDFNGRNVLVAHQFVTGSARCESEEISIGGQDNVDAAVFEGFDYVALGHLHGAQKAGGENIRYSGSPLKYSFSEVNHKKGGLMVELGAKGQIKIEPVLFEPKHDVRELKGTYEELTLRKNYENTATDDYIHITLTDEEDIPEGFAKLQGIYKNLCKLDYDNTRTRTNATVDTVVDVERTSPLELFSEFFKIQNNKDLSEEQKSFVQNLIEEIWGGEK
ncbi:MAG: exonuclease SbcCD subunit D [Treponema sp.]|nr:exonuclease SbcCD subunit D [Treponema sp.]